MPCLDIDKVERYMTSVLGTDVTVLALTDLKVTNGQLVKGVGYGAPVRVDYEIPGCGHWIAVFTSH
jgi:hypothetical protein